MNLGLEKQNAVFFVYFQGKIEWDFQQKALFFLTRASKVHLIRHRIFAHITTW